MTGRRQDRRNDIGPRTANRRRDARETRAHGWSRKSDGHGGATSAAIIRPRRSTRTGTALLMLAVTAILTAVGVARVHMRTRVLELGAEISNLTADQASLLDHRRRLEAERAYLRNPERVLEVARDQLKMVPIRPERVQRIELLKGEKSE